MLSPGGARGVEKAELNGNVDSDNNHGGSSRTYVLHRAGCSQEDDQLLRQGCEWSSSPGRQAWGNAPRAGIWMRTLPQPWTVAMEATIFTGWIYDHLHPHAAQIKVAHPLMLRAIAAAKKKNDRAPARSPIACAVTSCLSATWQPTEIRDRRRTLRYRYL